jgi:hypothetical protein
MSLMGSVFLFLRDALYDCRFVLFSCELLEYFSQTDIDIRIGRTLNCE